MKVHIRITRESQGGYRAWCPGYPGCLARGSSQGEAIRKVAAIMESYLASMNVSVPSLLETVVMSQ
jgi:predicted RNase H-like HicB family nuclease